MSQREVNALAGRMSLRPPQTDSLVKLASAIEASPAMLQPDRNAADVAAILATLKGQFPSLQDFEREFPSLCFALATGVGKTRLMGAFISYLFQAHGIKHFFVLAKSCKSSLKNFPTQLFGCCSPPPTLWPPEYRTPRWNRP